MAAEANRFWWSNMSKGVEENTKSCVACMASGKTLNYQLPKNEFGKLKTLSERGQEIQIDFSEKLNHKKTERRTPKIIRHRQI